MNWKNKLQLENEFSDTSFLELFKKAATVSELLKDSIISKNYQPPETLDSMINLSSEGEEWANKLLMANPSLSISEIKFSLLIFFNYKELFLDLESSDIDGLIDFLDDEILKNRIRFPWIFERQLYDIFFEMFPVQTTSLTYDETLALISEASQGVFQIMNYLVGPFGIIRSNENRNLSMSLKIPLWHCADPSCMYFHKVQLSDGKPDNITAIQLLYSEFKKMKYRPSEWKDFYYDQLKKDFEFYDTMHPFHLPHLLFNCFNTDELKAILCQLIINYPEDLRKVLEGKSQFKKILIGFPEKIVDGLNKSQIAQLILVVSDQKIINTVEKMIDKNNIIIPVTELRSPHYAYGFSSWLESNCQCSRFGIRTNPVEINASILQLKNVLKQIYTEDEEKRKLLEHKLRFEQGMTTFEKLDNYLHREDPKNIIKTMIFEIPGNLDKTFHILKYGHFIIPQTGRDEDIVTDKILWKLGFNIGLFPESPALFWQRLKEFEDIAQHNKGITENDKADIRGKGTNFFVSLEEILDDSLSFITWALLSDHYYITKFKCDFEEAREFMALKLNNYEISDSIKLKLNSSGKNNLFGLIKGFTALAEICEEIISEPDKYLRPDNEIPGFHNKSNIQLFPFLHKSMILDIRENELKILLSQLKEIPKDFEKSDIMNIRNNSDHKSNEFPSSERIIKTCREVSQIVLRMEEMGIYPLVYRFSQKNKDEYGRGIIELKNYKGRTIHVYKPSLFEACYLPKTDIPQIAVPCITVGDSNEISRFGFVEESNYQEMWKNYPRRKKRLIEDESEDND